MRRDPVDNIVNLTDAPHRFRLSVQNAPAGGSAGKQDAGPARSDITGSRQQAGEEEPVRGASDRAQNAVAIYKRATLANGFTSKVLPDGTITIRRPGLPDFRELDRCLKELSDLGIEPVHRRLAGSSG